MIKLLAPEVIKAPKAISVKRSFETLHKLLVT